jgi:hypothetical protein
LFLLLACGPEEGADALTVEFLDMHGQCIDPCPGGETYGSRSLEIRVTAGPQGYRGTARWLASETSDREIAAVDVSLVANESTTIEFDDDGCPSGPEGTRGVVVYVEVDDVVWALEGDYSVGMGYDC